jgi:hypothetical protein
MYWLIESSQQIEEFKNKSYSEVFCELITFNDNTHPAINELSLLYIKPLNNDKGCILCISHDETFSLDMTLITSILRGFNNIYVRDKKQFLHFFPFNNITEISKHLDKVPTTKTHIYFYQKHGTKYDINLIIPTSKHYERCELIYSDIKKYCKKETNSFLNKRAIIFSLIESNGIKIDEKEFKKHFKPLDPSRSIQDSTIFTNYNFYTTTGRPSNSYNGINFAALKKDGARKSFIPKNNYFIEYDLTAYHPTLVGKIIDFDFGKETPYEYFVREAGITVEKAKVEFIKQMYGGVFEKYTHIDFFKRLQIYVDNIWEEFNSKGLFICPESGNIFYKDKLEDMTPGKLLSYIIQNLETSHNVNMMWDMMRVLRGKETQLVLYVYDSFLFDVADGEEDVLKEIEKIFIKNKLKIKTNKGINYEFTK